jgi:hypothetical protein
VERDIKVTDASPYSGRGAVAGDVGAATHNLAVFNAAFAAAGAGDAPVYDPIYIPAKTYYCNPGWLIPGIGGRILTGGGVEYLIAGSQRGNQLRSCSIIEFVGGSAATPCVNYQGFGWYIGPLNFHAWPIDDDTQRNAVVAGTSAPYDVRRDVGFQVSALLDGAGRPVNNAVGMLFCDGMYFAGFKTAVLVDASAQAANGDRLHWKYLAAAATNTVFKSNNNQSVNDRVEQLDAVGPGDYAIDFEQGGNLLIDAINIEAGPRTLLKIGGAGGDQCNFDIRGIDIDATAIPGTKLLELASNVGYASVRMRGMYCHPYVVGNYDGGALPVVLGAGLASPRPGIINQGKTQVADVHLDVTGLSPAMAAAYPR